MVSDALKRLREEKRIAGDAMLTARAEQRRMEIYEAFKEGMAFGPVFEPEEAWRLSETRRALYAGPLLPEEPHIRALVRSRGRRRR